MKRAPIKTNKYTKTDTLTFRASKTTKYALELLARKQYRTMSNVLEYMIEKFAEKELGGLVNKVWDIDESVRIKNMKEHCPDLLSNDEIEEFFL